MKGAANVSLSMKDIATVEFPLPPIERQRELSNLFVSFQEKQKELSAEYEKQTEYAKLLRHNILQEAIEGKLTADWRKQNPVQKGNPDYDAEALFEQIQKGEVSPSLQPASQFSATPSAGSNAARNARSKSLAPITDEEKTFEIPESWKWVHLNNIALSGLGKTLNKSTDKRDECPYLCSINVYWEGIDLEVVKKARFTEQEKEKYRLQKGDLLICEGGESGRTAIWNHNIDMYYQNALHRIRFYGNVIPELYRYILEIYKLSGIINNYLKGMGIQHLVQSSLNAIWFPLPPLKEQKEIVNKVETLLAKVTTLENQIQDRRSLSEKLIFGIIKEKLEVKNDNLSGNN
jgi:type I restriction enzyme S subunit